MQDQDKVVGLFAAPVWEAGMGGGCSHSAWTVLRDFGESPVQPSQTLSSVNVPVSNTEMRQPEQKRTQPEPSCKTHPLLGPAHQLPLDACWKKHLLGLPREALQAS